MAETWTEKAARMVPMGAIANVQAVLHGMPIKATPEEWPAVRRALLDAAKDWDGTGSDFIPGMWGGSQLTGGRYHPMYAAHARAAVARLDADFNYTETQ